MTKSNPWGLLLCVCALLCERTRVCLCDFHPKFTPQPNHIRETGILERQHLGSVCVCMCVCNHIHKVIHNTFQSHYSLWRWGEEGLWEQVHASNKYGWKDGQKKERVRARIRWLLVYIRRKTAKGIKGIGRRDSHWRGSSWERNKKRKESVKWRQVIFNTQMGFKDDQQCEQKWVEGETETKRGVKWGRRREIEWWRWKWKTEWMEGGQGKKSSWKEKYPALIWDKTVVS